MVAKQLKNLLKFQADGMEVRVTLCTIGGEMIEGELLSMETGHRVENGVLYLHAVEEE